MATQAVSMGISLFFVINVLGNIPFYLALIGRYSVKQQQRIFIREFAIALAILLSFNYFGEKIFQCIGITPPILGIAGGILLLLISITMIFPPQWEEKKASQEPFIVPIATPMIAGPGSITTVMLFSAKVADPLVMTSIIIAATSASCAIALTSSFLKKGVGEKGLVALEKLGGMIVSLIGVQMFASATIELIKISFHL